jgi:hypothetical protein
MIRSLGFDVEYAPGAFGDDATYREIVSAAQFMQFPGNGKPALGVTITGVPIPGAVGTQQSLKLFVIVPESDDPLTVVLAFLARFEHIYRGSQSRTLNLQFRTIDGEPAP